MLIDEKKRNAVIAELKMYLIKGPIFFFYQTDMADDFSVPLLEEYWLSYRCIPLSSLSLNFAGALTTYIWFFKALESVCFMTLLIQGTCQSPDLPSLGNPVSFLQALVAMVSLLHQEAFTWLLASKVLPILTCHWISRTWDLFFMKRESFKARNS